MKKLILLIIVTLLVGGVADAKVKRQQRKRSTTTVRTATTAQTAPALYGRAAKWKDKAEAGDAEAQYELAFCYFWPIGTKQDYAKAMEWATKSSAQGYSEATELVGRMYHFGYGVTKDDDVADIWFKLAYQQAKPLADAGDAHAQHTIYILYYYGRGVAEDKAEARKWLEKSAAQGYHWAQYDLAYELDCDKEYSQAAHYYRLAAEQGNPMAQDNLGYDYAHGEGVTQDYSEAVKWYRLAAEQGFAKANNRMGRIYDPDYEDYGGVEIKKNYADANKWYQKAAELNHAEAQFNLGYNYKHGKGLAKNTTLANKWLRLAADNGNKKAKEELGLISSSNDDSYSSTMRNFAGVWRCSSSYTQYKFDSNGNGWFRNGNGRAWESLGVTYKSYNRISVYDAHATHILEVSGNKMTQDGSYVYYRQ